MITYKITNITENLGKRDVNFNKTLEISYVDDMMRRTINVKPQDTVYFTSNDLPLSVHKMRVKKLVSVSEISEKELNQIKNASNLKEDNKVTKLPDNKKSTTTTTTTKKKKTSSSSKKSTTTTTTTKKSVKDETKSIYLDGV